MRVGHKYVPEDSGPTARDAAPADFVATVGLRTFASREEFLAGASAGQGAEILAGLRALLRRDRPVLAVAAGSGQVEAQLRVEGYDVVASDFAPELLDEARRLVPELRTLQLDVLRPAHDGRYDDVVAIALDYALDDAELATFLDTVRGVLLPGGRLILAHTYRDTAATRLIDRVLLPLWARPRLAGRRRSEAPWVRKEHGFRRSERELVAAAAAKGFVLGRRIPYGWGLELIRIGVDVRAPRLYRAVERVSRRLGRFNYGTLLELTLRS